MKRLCILFSVLFIFSCSVHKRKYQKGFYVERIHHKSKSSDGIAKRSPQKVATLPKPTEQNPILITTGEIKTVVADVENEVSLIKKNTLIIPSAEDTCDVLFFKDGSEIRAKVTEISSTEVKYKRCDNQDGPGYVTRKADLFMIKYANGNREVIKVEEPVKPQVNKYNTFKNKRVNHPLAGLALALGILSVALPFIELMLLSLQTTLPGVFLGLMILSALLAVVVGKVVLNQIKHAPDVYKGRGLALPGFIMGVVMLGLYLLIFLIILAIFI